MFGFSIREISYKGKKLFYLGKEQFSGPWIKFRRMDLKDDDSIVLLKAIEPTPVYKLVNSKTGPTVNRVTIDLDISAYTKQKLQKNNQNLVIIDDNKKLYIRKYIDIYQFKQPYSISFFSFKNMSQTPLQDMTFFTFIDFDINGLEGFDNDMGKYDENNGMIIHYDESDTYAGFCSLSVPDNYEITLSNNIDLEGNLYQLRNIIEKNPGDITSALSWNIGDLNPNDIAQIPIIVAGGLSKGELIKNLSAGRERAKSLMKQVRKLITSQSRQIQDKKFLEINETVAKDC